MPSKVTTNLLVDYDIDALGLSDGTSITTMSDSSGNNHDATGVTSHKPISKDGGPNSKRYAQFNGSQIAKTTDINVLPSGTSERTVFIVIRTHTDPPSPDFNALQYGPNGSTNQYWSIGASGGSYIGYFWSSNSSGTDPGVMTDWHIIALQINSAGHPVWWLDGVKQSTDGGVNPNTGSGTVLSIGGNGNSNDGDMNGDIARILGHGALTDPEIVQQFSYLKATYFGLGGLITQYALETVVAPDTQKARLTQYALETVVAPDIQKARLTQFVIETVSDFSSISNATFAAAVMTAAAAMPNAILAGDSDLVAQVMTAAALMPVAQFFPLNAALLAESMLATASMPNAIFIYPINDSLVAELWTAAATMPVGQFFPINDVLLAAVMAADAAMPTGTFFPLSDIIDMESMTALAEMPNLLFTPSSEQWYFEVMTADAAMLDVAATISVPLDLVTLTASALMPSVQLVLIKTFALDLAASAVFSLSLRIRELLSAQLVLVVHASGGAFRLVYQSVSSSLIPYNASAAQTQEILEAHPLIGAGNVNVQGVSLTEGPQLITFQGDLSFIDFTSLRISNSTLTGDTAQANVKILRSGQAPLI